MNKYEKLNFVEIYLLFDMFTESRMQLTLKKIIIASYKHIE